MNVNFNQIRILTDDLTVLEFVKKILLTYNWKNVVTTLVPLFLNGSASFLQVIETIRKTWLSLNFCQI